MELKRMENIQTNDKYLYGVDKDKKLYNIIGHKCHCDREKILIYGDVNTNIIDGSSVWLINIATLFARKYKVDILLKAIPQNDLLISKLKKNKNINIISPDQFPNHLEHFGDTYYLKDYSASELIYRLDMENEYPFIVCRGFYVSYYLANNPYIKDKLITYLLVQHGDKTCIERKQQINLMLKNSKIILLQTELAKNNIVNNFDGDEEKILLLPPVIDDHDYSKHVDVDDRKLGCLYTGKFDVNWRIPDILEIFIRSRKNITLVGNKFHAQLVNGKKLRNYFFDTVDKNDNIEYLGGLPHDEIPKLIKKYDYGISVRTEEFLKSLEFSTKVLEFGYLSKPTIVNDSKINRLVLGEDYPLFANTNEEILECMKKVENNEIYQKAAERCYSVAQKHTMTSIASYLFPNIEKLLRENKDDVEYFITNINVKTANYFDIDKKNNILFMDDIELYDQKETFIRAFKWSDIIIYNYEESSVNDILNLAEKYDKKIVLVYENNIGNKIRNSKNVFNVFSKEEYQNLNLDNYHNIIRTSNNIIDFSIIIPSKDTPDYMLYRAIDSILDQKHIEKYKYEIIIIDDESENLVSKAIDKKYKETYPIRVIRNEHNQGLGFSRNIGLEYSRGKHIYFLDADDFYNDIFISSIEKKLENNNYTLVVCAMKTLYEDTNKTTTDNHINVAIDNLLDPSYNIKLEGIIRLVNSVVKGFRKKDMIKNRYFHDRGYHEDVFTWMKYCFESEPMIEVCKDANYIRTIRDGSNQITQNKDILKNRLQHLNLINLKIVDLLKYLNKDDKFDKLIDFYSRRYLTIKNQLKNLL